MHFLYEPRRFWIRRGTHTVVSERDPRFGRFRSRPDGEVRTYMRVWLDRWDGVPRYLGGVWVRASGPLAKELARLDRRVRRIAGGDAAVRLRRKLVNQLSEFSNEREAHCG